MRPAERGPRCGPLTPRDGAPGRGGQPRRQHRHRLDLLDRGPGQALSGQPIETTRAQRAGRPVIRGGHATRDQAHLPPQQRMRGRQREHPAHRIPAGLGQEHRIKPGGQLRGCAGDSLPGKQVVELGGHRARARRQGRCGRAGHRVTPTTAVCSRGLGTRSTAARSRLESGCRYTCAEDTEACPSRSATTSMPHPASATLLPKACRSWCGVTGSGRPLGGTRRPTAPRPRPVASARRSVHGTGSPRRNHRPRPAAPASARERTYRRPARSESPVAPSVVVVTWPTPHWDCHPDGPHADVILRSGIQADESH